MSAIKMTQAMRHRRAVIVDLLLALFLPGLISSFSLPVCVKNPLRHRTAASTERTWLHTSTLRHYKSTVSFATSKKKSKSGPSVPRNEFSRTFEPDLILKSRRDYRISLIEASEDECKDLAKRFGLSDVSKLEASLTLRQESLGGGTIGSNGVEATGNIVATITQTCVRTNEHFEVNLEFPFYSIVRPTIRMSHFTSQEDQNNGDFGDEYDVEDYSRSTKKQRRKSYRGQSQNIDDMDLLQLQRMMQEDISIEDDALMEDEAIFPAGGLLDVGELVTQLFFLKIDPYPKKPGTDPIQRSISG